MDFINKKRDKINQNIVLDEIPKYKIQYSNNSKAVSNKQKTNNPNKYVKSINSTSNFVVGNQNKPQKNIFQDFNSNKQKDVVKNNNKKSLRKESSDSFMSFSSSEAPNQYEAFSKLKPVEETDTEIDSINENYNINDCLDDFNEENEDKYIHTTKNVKNDKYNKNISTKLNNLINNKQEFKYKNINNMSDDDESSDPIVSIKKISNKYTNINANKNDVEISQTNNSAKVNKQSNEKSEEIDFIAFPKDIQYINSEQRQFIKVSENDYNELPWMTNEIKKAYGFHKLHLEIIEFTKLITPTEEEDYLRERSIQIIKQAIKDEHPEWKVKTFGSYPVGLHLPDSDVDIVVVLDQNCKYSEDEVFIKIEKLLKKDKNKNALVSYSQIIKAKVPILKATLKETNIQIDITINRTNGYKTKHDVKKILKHTPSLKRLIYVLKYFLRQRSLNDAYKGGVSSFLLFNLCYAFFNYHIAKMQFSKAEFNDMTLGHLLLEFFDFYGSLFNYDKVGISIRNGCYFYNRVDHESKGRSFLAVENYQDVNLDVGSGAFRFRTVVDTFKNARDKLKYPDHVKNSYLEKIINVDTFLVERANRLNKQKLSEIEESDKSTS